MTQYQRDETAPRRAEREALAELPETSRHEICEHAMDPACGENEYQERKASDQHQAKR